MKPVTGDLIARAQGGDGDAFRELTEPYRRELQVHCYRMLGSFQDAEDALQDTLVSAWQGLGEFEGRASLRTWLYRIATNRCLNARRSASRRPAKEWVARIDDLETVVAKLRCENNDLVETNTRLTQLAGQQHDDLDTANTLLRRYMKEASRAQAKPIVSSS